MTDRPPARCAVLGDPIGHSLSPVLHRAAYAALGLDWSYDAVRVPTGGLAGFLDEVAAQRARGVAWRGLSLTMPLKREVMALADEVCEPARSAGAANTLWWDGDRVVADNTDVPGAVAAVRERTGSALGSGVVVGGGATATSTGLALLSLGVADLTVLAREPAHAMETEQALVEAARRSGARVRLERLVADDRRPFVADVLVSTVPAAAQGPALVERAAGVAVLFEVLYDPWPTPLAAAVAADPARTLVSGLDLLAHQALLQLARFTGGVVAEQEFARRLDVDVLRVAGEAALSG